MNHDLGAVLATQESRASTRTATHSLTSLGRKKKRKDSHDKTDKKGKEKNTKEKDRMN